MKFFKTMYILIKINNCILMYFLLYCRKVCIYAQVPVIPECVCALANTAIVRLLSAAQRAQ